MVVRAVALGVQGFHHLQHLSLIHIYQHGGFNGKVALCQPIGRGLAEVINGQEGLYTLYLRGFADGRKVSEKRVISAVSRCLDPYADFDALLA